MIALVWLLLAPAQALPPPTPELRAAPPSPPRTVVIATARGAASVPVTTERGGPAVAAPRVASLLALTVTLDGPQATIGLDSAVFVFQLGLPFVRAGGVVYGLIDEPYVARDTLFLPLSWLADCVPRALGARYRWDPDAARLAELPALAPLRAGVAPGLAAPSPRTPEPPVAVAPAAPSASPAPLAATARAAAPNPPPAFTGLRQHHAVVVDPGHGGADPGNPGQYFPDHLVEKDITLAIARLLRAELLRRGIATTLTRSTDTLVDLADRGAMCRAECDLFVSIHVNSMPRGNHAARASGVETYFLSDAKTEDQERVAKMENDAIRFETGRSGPATGPLGFILRDLQSNEYLRESAGLAELVQGHVAEIQPGGDHGLQQAGFTVLATARRPAILVETGFATNPTDGAFLASGLGQHKIATAIADGIVAYLIKFERKMALAAPAGSR